MLWAGLQYSVFSFQLCKALRWPKGRVIDLIDYENEKLHADNDAGREMSNNIIKTVRLHPPPRRDRTVKCGINLRLNLICLPPPVFHRLPPTAFPTLHRFTAPHWLITAAPRNFVNPIFHGGIRTLCSPESLVINIAFGLWARVLPGGGSTKDSYGKMLSLSYPTLRIFRN